MKHIKKKFLFHNFLNGKKENYLIEMNEIINIPDEIDTQRVLKKAKGQVGIITKTNGENIFSMVYNDNGNFCMIPVPDFTLMNYNQAYFYNIKRKELRKELMKHFNKLNNGEDKNFAFAYEFQGYSSATVIMLFTALECFVNDIIPEDYIYTITNNKRTESYNKIQIQENIQILEKLKNVLPDIFKKNFSLKNTHANNHIMNLRELRNSIIHTKSDPTGKYHSEILKKLLDYKYDETFNAISLFFNFYKEKFIEDCPCKEDY